MDAVELWQTVGSYNSTDCGRLDLLTIISINEMLFLVQRQKGFTHSHVL